MGDTDSYLLRNHARFKASSGVDGPRVRFIAVRARAVVGGQCRARCCRPDGRARDGVAQVSLRRVSLRDTPLFRSRFYSNVNRLWA